MIKYTEIFDISVPLSPDTPVFPGDPPFSRELVSTIPQSGFELSKISMSAHAGTHLDAPAHVIAGARTIDAHDPGRFILPALVVEASPISVGLLENAGIEQGDAVLVKTGSSGSNAESMREQTGLSIEAAEFLPTLFIAPPQARGFAPPTI